ncbi:MAG: HEAT repeat domain-containing protein [Aggregatilineales bacterium]
MADRRLVDYNISRLHDKNPAVRVKSIGELRLLDDPAGWEAIEQLYQADHEPEVHQAAQTALVNYYMFRLQDNDDAVRLKAIAELRQMSDPAALAVLEQVYRTDSNADVRRAAQEAGLEIFVKNRKLSTGPL